MKLIPPILFFAGLIGTAYALYQIDNGYLMLGVALLCALIGLTYEDGERR